MARPKLGDGEPERLHVKISTEELTAIDDWRFKNRVPSRSEAVRRLCRIALIWDRHSSRLQENLGKLNEAFRETEKTAALLGDPSDDMPKWALDYIVASMEAMMDLADRTADLAGSIAVIGAPADIMKIDGKFDDIINESKRSELLFIGEILEKQVENFQKTQDQGDDK